MTAHHRIPTLMKFLLPLLAAVSLSSCSTPEQNARLSAIGNLAINYAETKGVISASDAAAVREAGKILLSDPAESPLPVIDVTSGK